jgi:WD40 repeat protein
MKRIIFLLSVFFTVNTFAQKIELRIPIGHTGPVQAIDISPDSRFLATGSSDQSVKIWSIAEGKQIRTLGLASGVWRNVKFIDDNRHLSVCMEEGWEYWDAITGKREHQFYVQKDYGKPSVIYILSDNGKKIAVCSSSSIEIRDVTDGKLIYNFNWQAQDKTGFQYYNFALNDRWFVYAGKDQLFVYDLLSKDIASLNINVETDISGIVLSKTKDELFIAGYHTLYKIDLKKRSLLQTKSWYSNSRDYSLSVDEKHFIDGTHIYNASTLEKENSVNAKTKDSRSIANDLYYVTFDWKAGVGELFSLPFYSKIRDFANETAWLQKMLVDNESNELIFTTDLKEARIWDLKSYRFTQTIHLDGGNIISKPSKFDSYFTKGGNYFAGTYSDGVVVNYHTGKTVYTPHKRIIELSPDGTVGFSEQAGKGSIIDLNTGTEIKAVALTYPDFKALPDNKTVLFYKYADSEVHIYNYRQLTETIVTMLIGVEPQFNKDGSKLYTLDRLYYQNKDPLYLTITEMPSGRRLGNVLLKNLENMEHRRVAVSKDEKFAAVLYKPADKFYMVKDNLIIVYEIATGKEVCRSLNIDGADEIQFINSNLLAVQNGLSNTIGIYAAQSCNHLLDITHFKGNDDWIAVSPEGFYDGNMQSLKKFYFVKGNEFVDPDLYFEKFYTPNLFARILNGERFKADDAINKVPVVKMTYAAIQRNLSVEDDVPGYQNTTGLAEITVKAIASDDAVDEIRLFHNGKIVTLTTRNLIVADDNKSSAVTKKYNVSLLPGVNTFRSVALNSQRTESKPDLFTVEYKQSGASADIKPIINNDVNGPVASIDMNATLHLVVVGINQYQNKSMRLNYALADASAFKAEVEQDAKTVISNIKTYFVTDDKADKTGITNALKEVQQNAKANDVFIFYYAGHGVIGKDKEFYLVPSDVSDLKNVQAELEQKGIAAKLLQQYAIDIPAQKQLFILDACQSAGAFETMMTADANQQKSIALVARSTGTHWMAASGAKQFANEFSSLGHGAFTYVLLQALKGEAANNKMVTVNGLKNFLQLQVPALMKKYNGAAQYPASYGFGNDFPVEITNK